MLLLGIKGRKSFKKVVSGTSEVVIKGTEESTLDLASSFRRILLTIAKLCVRSPILQCMEFCLVFLNERELKQTGMGEM